MIKCYRCGRPAWYQDRETGRPLCLDHGHLEVRDERRGRGPAPALTVRTGAPADLPAILALWDHFWDDDGMDCFGHQYQAVDLPHLLLCDGGRVVGLLSYAVERGWDALNIVALNILPGYQGRGGAGDLIARLERRARGLGIGRLIVATSNDNVLALYFYQRLGFRLTGLLVDAIEPNGAGEHFVGLGGIPVRDEIRLEKRL